MLDQLLTEASALGKPAWRPMLRYVAELHAKATHPPRDVFPHPWEEIGPGYCYGPAFGHWDIVHQVLDVLPAQRDHARDQLLNNLHNQQPDGFVPGSIWVRDEPMPWHTAADKSRIEQGVRWNNNVTHPPLWPVAVQDFADIHDEPGLVQRCYEPLLRMIGWWEAHRKAEPAGFYYTDILNHSWESGIDEGIRFLEVATGPLACVDATAHVYWLYKYAARWSATVGHDETPFAAKAAELERFMQERLYDPETGFFHDIWLAGRPELRRWAFEGFWPLVVGAATPEQAHRVIHENLLNPERFFTAHPISTVGVGDRRFELRMWRGPAWNSMTYWAARGCLHYRQKAAAKKLLEAALDDSATWFEHTGTIWEFYHPHGGDPRTCQRKPHTKFNAPCLDYLGHNPVLAMARLWERCG